MTCSEEILKTGANYDKEPENIKQQLILEARKNTENEKKMIKVIMELENERNLCSLHLNEIKKLKKEIEEFRTKET